MYMYYVAYNFNHFAIFLPKFIKICENLNVLTKPKMLLFSETQCIGKAESCLCFAS